MGFTTNTKLVLSQLRQRKFWSIHIQILTNFKIFIFKQFRTFRPSPICTFHRSRKICTCIDEQFCTFHRSLHESVAFYQTKQIISQKEFKSAKDPLRGILKGGFRSGNRRLHKEELLLITFYC